MSRSLSDQYSGISDLDPVPPQHSEVANFSPTQMCIVFFDHAHCRYWRKTLNPGLENELPSNSPPPPPSPSGWLPRRCPATRRAAVAAFSRRGAATPGRTRPSHEAPQRPTPRSAEERVAGEEW